ncbi:serine hydrolase [Jiulongibacter sediminis]|uniref:Beta-lactamase n=1 Tax=Jiulongibacter sediminis TaxID=1605367 RepID=A0A0P7BYY5_9BACT|nr:serine hydrolase [Jiulongibacter sediminis]KPM47345.1 beta-lactamase [Jiulongibacter sediminis]TBX22902.1 beta-lactamase [Jiulongibacter sediminis]
MTLHLVKKYLVLGFILLPILSFSQRKVDFEKLDQYFSKSQKEWGVPGISIGIVKDGELVFSKGYGTLEYGKKEQPDAETNFAIASNSKAFTSAIMGMLVQEGKLKWTDKVRDYLPYFALYDDFVSENTTIEDILSHRVGLTTFGGDIMWYNSDFTSEEIISNIRHLKPAYGFRDGFGYSNVMFITAGEIIKTVTGKSWYDNVKERILDPLEMDRTFVNVPQMVAAGNSAKPHTLINDSENQAIPYTSWEEIAATGGLFSNVDDLSKWVIFNLKNGVVGDDTLFTRSTRNTLWNQHNMFAIDRTQSNPYGAHFAGYGLGWFLRDYHGKLRVYHTGGYDGMISSINMLPEENLGVIVLTNGLKAPIGSIPAYVFDAFMGREETDWSTIDLKRHNESYASDTRIEDLRKARQEGTSPIILAEDLIGTYHSDLYGDIEVKMNGDKLEIIFPHTASLQADLTHWHHDTYQMHFVKKHPWFTLALVKFTSDASQKVTGIEFTVPNNDFWFEELNAIKVK